jgi:hypothetical protein
MGQSETFKIARSMAIAYAAVLLGSVPFVWPDVSIWQTIELVLALPVFVVVPIVSDARLQRTSSALWSAMLVASAYVIAAGGELTEIAKMPGSPDTSGLVFQSLGVFLAVLAMIRLALIWKRGIVHR